MVSDADVYEAFARARPGGRQYGWWRLSRDVLTEFQRRHRPMPGPNLLLGRPIRVVAGVDVFEFVEHSHPPARRRPRKYRLR